MSKISKAAKEFKKETELKEKGAVENYMGGISYEINPIDTLKMVTASSIFGEPQYYRDGAFKQAGVKDEIFRLHPLFEDFSIFDNSFNNKKTSEIMEEVIDSALDYDFNATLDWAVELRKEFNMRLNPQVILVRAAMHPKRVEFNNANPGKFAKVESFVLSRADEPASQLAYYLYKNEGKKNNIPNVLKKAWAKKLSGLNAYQVHKYKNAGLGMIDTVRICHANSEVLDELMKTGNVTVSEDEQTWETLRASGMSFREIYEKGVFGHMALLRNLRNIFNEIKDDEDFAKKVLEDLKSGVKNGKQFPFRYYTALQQVKQSPVSHLPLVLDALEDCIDLAMENLPKLKGKTMCLSDNSGSAWGAIPSEYGKVKIATIDNLSSVITAMNSDEGYVGKFGDDLKIFPIKKRDGILSQTEKINKNGMNDVGGGTENGVWLFFKKAIENKEHWDNIFIYSDQQAGHGGLYGTSKGINEYTQAGYAVNNKHLSTYVDVAKLIDTYRKQVNPKVNVFSVQTAGYKNVCVPEYGYRTNILYGWTGKELLFANEMIKLWDEIEKEA